MGVVVVVRSRCRRIFSFAVAAVGAWLLIGLGEAWAQTASCTDTSGYSYSQCTGDANKAGVTVIGVETMKAAVGQTVGLISSRIEQFTRVASNAPENRAVAAAGAPLVALGTGTSAGDAATRFGAWASGSWSDVEGTKSNVKFDGNIWTGMVGGDYKFTERVIAGLAVGYEALDVDTSFNRGSTESSGWTVAPYAIFRIDDVFSVDVNVGYTNVDYDIDRKDPLSNATITSDTDSDRWFGAVNLSGNWMVDSWALGANVGTLFAYEDRDGFRESNGTEVSGDKIRLGRLNLGGRLGYLFRNVFEPYGKAKLEYDYSRDATAYDDRVGLVVGAGFNIFATDNFYANVEGTTVLLRDDLDIHTVSATLRYDF